MAFWSAVGTEPKRAHRWVVTFPAAGVNLQQISYALKKVDKPKAKVGEITHKYLNHSFYYPGRLEWEAVNMTFASVTQVDANQLVNDVLLAAGYGVPQNAGITPEQRATIGKNKFAGALGRKIYIQQVDADGEKIEEWELNNPFFTSVQFGALDYSSEEIVEISCTVRYDWAKLNTPALTPGEPEIPTPPAGSPGIP
jgi:hypothetical protein